MDCLYSLILRNGVLASQTGNLDAENHRQNSPGLYQLIRTHISRLF